MSPATSGAERGESGRFGALLRDWRVRRSASQLRLATEAGISPRHLSFLETGRSQPSREMVVRLAETLDVPLRERNRLLAAAGYAALYREHSLGTDVLAPIERMLDFLLERLEPYPAFLLDRKLALIRANAAGLQTFAPFVRDDPVWRESPLNLARLTLHAEGLRPSIVNFDEVAGALLVRLAREAALDDRESGLKRLVEELSGLPGLAELLRRSDATRPAPPILAMHLKSAAVELRFFSMLTTLGTPQDVTLEGLHIECFMPADEATDRWLRGAR